MKSIIATIALCVAFSGFGQTNAPLKQHGAFFTKERLAQVQANARQGWVAQVRSQIVSNAVPWLEASDDELWDMMFGATIPRSWMVWSNGHCPACKKSVEMYRWKMDAWKHPWKTQCPHCNEFFPKNDFETFYKSGLDEHGVFNQALADRKLLFNAEHPDPSDPLHGFGVDDGLGYVADGNRWRFIGAYLIFGQYHQKVIAGIDTLAAAYVLTGDSRYAHKAGILLDRVADLYPTFDFAQQGFVYETGGHNGYVTVWHDTSEETYEMVLAYDQAFEGMRNDPPLVEFLAGKAKQFKLANPKQTFADIQRNIESRILRDALAHPEKIYSNFPRQQCTTAAIMTVLGWPENRAEVEKYIDSFVGPATAVDGLTGEKGLSGYTSYTIAAMARFFNEYARVDAGFLTDLMKRNPGLRQTYRFHMDTHCLQRFYPASGDTGSFAQPYLRNPVMIFGQFRPASLRSPLAPSMMSFYWRLFCETGDPAYAQAVYCENGHSVTNLPYDIFEPEPKLVQKAAAKVIAKCGSDPTPGSIDKQNWHMAILRSGKGDQSRAVSLDYDAGGGHGHKDAMTLGLFACGLDLLPDFGYPPVQFGGWGTPRANWYKMTAAHNTVMLDRRDQADGAGKTTLWANGKNFRTVRVSGPGLVGAQQYERTVSLIDVSPESCYVIDVFRVVGGTEHCKFVHGTFGAMDTDGLSLSTVTNDFSSAFQLSNFRADSAAKPGWSATWCIEDHFNVLSNRWNVKMRYTDLTGDCEAISAKAWIVPAYFNNASPDGTWNPCLIVRRKGNAPLASTFVSVYEPFTRRPAVAAVQRLPLENSGGKPVSDACVAVEVRLVDGRTDLWVAGDVENPLKRVVASAEDRLLVQPNSGLRSDAELGWLRRNKHGRIEAAALCNGSVLQLPATGAPVQGKVDFCEFEARHGRLKQVPARTR